MGDAIQHIAFRASDATAAHVNKIGRVFDWKVGQRHMLKVESVLGIFATIKVKVNGRQIDPSEEYEVQTRSWPLMARGEKRITARVY